MTTRRGRKESASVAEAGHSAELVFDRKTASSLQEKWGSTVLSGLIEFSSERRRRIVPSSIPRTRLTRGKLFVDIIEDRRRPSLFLSVVQGPGSREILFLGQFRSRSEAESAADEFIADHLGRRKSLGKPAA